MKDLNEKVAEINEVLNDVSIELFDDYYLSQDDSTLVEQICPLDYIYKSIARKKTSGCYFLSGQKGSGKTTQLFNLKRKLEADKYFVVYCDVANKINLFDLHYVDFFLAILKSITEQLVNKDIYLNYTVLGKVHLTELRDMIPFKSLDFNLKFSMISDYIKYSDYLREKVRYIFDSQAISFIDGFKDVLNETKKILQDLNYKDIIVIVDGLDKVNNHNESTKLNVFSLFTDYSLLIKSLDTKMIVTLPFDTVFSPDKADINTVWEEDILIVPLYQLKGEEAKKQFFQILDKRFSLIGYKLDNIADGKVIRLLTQLSGGNIGQFIYLLSHCLNCCESLPLNETVVNKVKTVYKLKLLSQLSSDDLELINTFASKSYNKSCCISRKLVNLNIFFYSSVNDQFYINPVI